MGIAVSSDSMNVRVTIYFKLYKYVIKRIGPKFEPKFMKIPVADSYWRPHPKIGVRDPSHTIMRTNIMT